MLIRSFAYALLVLSLPLLASASQSALSIIDAMFQAMGGKEKLSQIAQVDDDAKAHLYQIEQSERPEGPWFTVYGNSHQTLNFQTSEYVEHGTISELNVPGGAEMKVQYSVGSNPLSGKESYYSTNPTTALNRLALGPERLFFTALASPDLKCQGRTTYHQIPHHVLTFSFGHQQVTVWVNTYNHLPAAIETLDEGPDVFWRVWGDDLQSACHQIRKEPAPGAAEDGLVAFPNAPTNSGTLNKVPETRTGFGE
jgi:hypothetical protein